jgi:hypothetical protein
VLRSKLLISTIAVLAMVAPPSAAGELDVRATVAGGEVAPPPGAISDNVEYVGHLPEPGVSIAVNWIGDTMFVSSTTGIFAYDASDPAAPRLVGSLPTQIWQNEDMDVDAERGLLFIARDPRLAPGAPEQHRLRGVVQIIDVSDPELMVPIGSFVVPAGHTTSCISAGEGPCDFLWTGGPYASTALGDPRGRPIYATDIRDPQRPVQCPVPVNTGLRPDGDTGYAHDVDVDSSGVAWVASDGGVHGWWTFGEHLDPRTGTVRPATPCDPVPYAGGVSPTGATPSRFMHNSQRPANAAIPRDESSRGMVLYATEEAFGGCETTGRFATYDLRTSLGGAGFTKPTEFEMTALDTWTPEGQEGATGCASAHYFDDRGDGLVAYGFYAQGVRFLDVTDPGDIRQVGYFRPNGTSAYAAYWHDGLVYVPDSGTGAGVTGVHILRFTDAEGGEVATGGAASLPTVAAPALDAAGLAARPPVRLDPATGYTCLLRA